MKHFDYINPQTDNLYLVSIFKAMKEFIEDECNGKTVCSDLRLMGKIKAARTLFGEDMKKLPHLVRAL
jgi:hypothetical protein